MPQGLNCKNHVTKSFPPVLILRGDEAMKYAIEIENLTKSFKGLKAVDNLSMHVPEGKVYGFLGMNGAGKTTTIRMITGLIRQEKGRIAVFGRDTVNDRLQTARNIGAIVETPGFYENLTACENLAITTELYDVDKKRIDEVLETVGLSEVGKKKAKEFSLGMKQRLGIANAMVHSPKILILDEPTNGLDPAGIKDIREFMRKLANDFGITIMVSSHILSEVQQVADFAGIINKGRLVQEIDIRSLKAEDQSCLMLQVDKTEKALDVLKDMRLNFKVDSGSIKVICKRSMNSSINRNLVSCGIDVYSLSPVQENLEDLFLSIIEGGGLTA
jgi:ABC-type multidrug transport system, ATPase component